MSEKQLLIKALNGDPVERPPVWMMRQAGRYLPEFMKLREKYDFFTRVQTPELACEITLQPVDRLAVDAAILFSDILVVPQAMGKEVLMVDGIGPVLPDPITKPADVDSLITDTAEDKLQYVYEAIKLTRNELDENIPLIGFAGAPFTILCYLIEGKGSKNFFKARRFCYTEPEAAGLLLQKITDITIDYLRFQVKAGIEVVQIFDSWSGLLSPEMFDILCLPFLEQISDALSTHVPVILFPKGSWYALEKLSNTSASAIGIDWTIKPEKARELTNGKICLQGNFDPIMLYQDVKSIQRGVHRMIQSFGSQNYIVNLGHGILPDVPVDGAKAFVDSVKTYQEKLLTV
ncbi:MAG: uroporphyrinogen decarboxylase [Bacteroidetes bacterium]|nr:uroporphyrinogen decarboxylase [Bacteroidota bacterium]